MKKLITFILTASLLLSAFSLCVVAQETSKWVISKDATVVLPAEITKGYSEMNSDAIDVSLAGYNYLHLTVTFADDIHVEYPTAWGYMLMLDDENILGAFESSQNVVANNILAATNDYVKDTPYTFAIPLSGFTAYGSGSIAPTEWTNNLKRLRFVFVGGGLNGNPEITISNIYLSVNEDDTAPSDGNNQDTESNTDTAAETGDAFMAIAALAVVAAATVMVAKKKKEF